MDLTWPLDVVVLNILETPDKKSVVHIKLKIPKILEKCAMTWSLSFK